MSDIIQIIFCLFAVCFLFFIIGYCCGSDQKVKEPKTICKNCTHCELVYIDEKGETKIKTDHECSQGSCFDPYATISCKRFRDKDKYNDF